MPINSWLAQVIFSAFVPVFVDSSSNKVFLELKDPDFIQTVNPNDATTGSPKYYAVYDVDNFVVGPYPKFFLHGSA